MTFSKLLLNGSVSGKQISVPVTGAFPTGNFSGILVHSGAGSPTSLDEVYIYAANNLSGIDSTILLTWGGLQSGDYMFFPVPAQNGRVLLTDGKLISSGLSITAWSNQSGTILDGFVNRIT